jgi:hypothetical protein
MIIFLLISILFSQNTEKYVVNSKMDTFYDISSIFLYPINLEHDEIIFYGTGGGVLRTYDNGQTWKQNFTGTHALIWKMIYHNELLFAINLDGRFMISEDKGDYWKIYKVADTLTSIAVLDNKIFATSDKNVYVSNNFGSNWEKLPTDFISIKTISNFNDKLILTTENNILYYSDDYGVSWNIFYTPIINWRVNDKHENFYIYNRKEILKLNDDLTWTRYDVSNLNQFFVFTESENGFIFAISFLEPYNAKIKIYEYNIAENNTIEISEIWKIGLSDFPPFDINSYQVNDMVINNGNLYLANTFKTILKSSIDDYNWKVVSNFGTINYSTNIKDSLTWINPTGSKNCITYTTNGGATFEISDTIVLNVRNPTADTLRRITPRITWMTFGGSFTLLQYSNSGTDIENPGSMQNMSQWFGLLNEKEKIVESFNLRLRHDQSFAVFATLKILLSYNDKFLMDYSYKLRTSSNNPPTKDSIYKHHLFFINTDKTVDTIGTIQDSIQILSAFVDNKNKLYVYGNRDLFTSEFKEDKLGIYQFNEETGEFDFIMSCPLYESTFDLNMFQNKKEEIFISPKGYLYKLDFNIKNYELITNSFDEMFTQSEFLENGSFIEDQKVIDLSKIEENGITKIRRKILKFETDMNYQILEEFATTTNDRYMYPSNTNIDYEVYYKNNGIYGSYFKPIEPERLEYYKSVKKTETRNYLWTNPPYPQPTNSIVKVETYWDSGLPFTEKDIEIYDITGIKINTENTLTVQKESIYKGHIIWDASSYKTGIYIMKITHGTETRVRKIMVVE